MAAINFKPIDFKPLPALPPSGVNAEGIPQGDMSAFRASQPTPGASFANLKSNLAKVPGQLKDLGATSAILPTAGAIGGGLLGGAAGVVGGPAGVIAGGIAGAGLGAGAGQAARQKLAGSPLNIGDVAKTGAEYAALEAVGGPVASIAGKVLKAGGKKLAEAFIPTSAKEAQYLLAYKAATPFGERFKAALGFGEDTAPQTAGSTAFDKGLMGTESGIGVRAKRTASSLWSALIQPALKQNKDVLIDMPKFFDEIGSKIIANNPERSRQKELLEALDALKADYKGVNFANPEQLQQFKEGWAKFIPDKAYRGKPIAGSFKEVQDEAADGARQLLYDILGPDVRQAYFDYGNLQGLQELGQTAMQGRIKGGTGTSVKGLMEAFTVPIGTVGGQTVYKVGQGVELIGRPGARTLRDLLGIPLGLSDQPESVSPTATPPSTPQPIRFQPKVIK